MPYVASRRQNADDRELIDVEVKNVAQAIVNISDVPMLVFEFFNDSMRQVCSVIRACENGFGANAHLPAQKLGRVIYDVSRKYEYEGAWLGELNYATTRLIQEIPKVMVDKGLMKTELRYWFYAETVGYLGALSHYFQSISNTNWIDQGFAGVFEDIKDEYKWRVNRSYEAYQIIKSGDCYDTPYYTKLVEVTDSKGFHRGYMDISVKRSDTTVNKDVIGKVIIDG